MDLSGSLQGAGGIGGLLAMQATQGTTDPADDLNYAYFYDANGNVGQLINIANTVMSAVYEYDPYGNALVAGAFAASFNPFCFSTKYADTELAMGTADDMYYYGYRYYLPRLGRWLNRDPNEEQGGNNLYAYVENTPTTSVDAFGLEPQGDILTGLHVCCRKPDVNTTGAGLVTHGDLRLGGCTTNEQEFSVWLDRSCNRKLDDGKKCCCASENDIRVCLNRNPYSDRPRGAEGGGLKCGGGEVGNNCQTSTIIQLGKCCLKSRWQPSWYAGNPRGYCEKGHWEYYHAVTVRPHWVCDKWVDLPEWRK